MKQIQKALDASPSDVSLSARLELIKGQLDALDGRWYADKAHLNCNLAAASILMLSFATAISCATPVATALCFVGATFAIALYVSASDYKNFRLKAFEKGHESNTDKSQKAYHDAQNQFIKTFAKTIIVPPFFMAVLAVSPMIAASLLLAHLTYQWSKPLFALPEDVPMPTLNQAAA